jgi:hypothetical protein
MPQKRNSICAFILGILSIAAIVPFCAVAAEGLATSTSLPALTTPAPVDAPNDPIALVVATQLRAVQARDETAAFAQMTQQLQAHYKNDARTYMSTLRLQQHQLYNHRVFHVLDKTQNTNLAIHKVELQGRDGSKTLAIFRLKQQADGVWKIDAIAVVPDTDERGA